MKYTRALALLTSLTLGVAPLTIVTTAADAANPCRLPRGVLKSGDLAARSAVQCLAVGRLVDAGDGTPIPIQPPGRSVTLGQLYPTGARTYTSTTDARGVVTTRVNGTVTNSARSGSAVEFPDVAGPGACERDSYVLAGFKWYWPWLYRTTIGTTLGTDSLADFDAATRRGTANMTRGHNTCGISGGTGAIGAFIGHTTAQGNFIYTGDQVTCGTPDYQNVLGEGDHPGGFLEATLATYCVWSVTIHGINVAYSADLNFNDGDYNWTYNPNDPACQPALPPEPNRWRYDVESVMTHEAGHVFGLVNLSAPEDINQTMWPGIRRCSGHMRTIGRGDLLGMRAMYGPTR